MPYETTKQQLQRLTDLAAQAPDIVKGLAETNLEESDLFPEVLRLADEVWQEGREQIASYNEREKNVLSKEKEVEERLADRPVSTVDSERKLPESLRRTGLTIVIGSLISLILTLGISGFAIGWKMTFGKLFTTSAAIPVVVTVVVSLALIWMTYLIIGLGNWRSAQKRAIEVDNEKRWQASLETLQKVATTLRTELTAAEIDIDKTLTDKISSLLRVYLNSETDASFVTRLKVLRAPGLAEVLDKVSAIDTSAKDRLLFMLNNMPGGSIGIAGSRGAGKTTLLRLFCGPKKILDTLKDKPVLPVLVSAPVEYQPRDFILYLFSSICRSFLIFKQEPFFAPREPKSPFSEPSLSSLPIPKGVRPLGRLFLNLGLSLVLVGLVLALLLAISSRRSVGQQPIESDQLRASGAQTEPSPAPTPGAPTLTSSQAQVPATSKEWFVLTFIKALKVEPGAILTWGLYGVGAGLLLIAITSSTISEFYLRSMSSSGITRILFMHFIRKQRQIEQWEREHEQEAEDHREQKKAQRRIAEAGKALIEIAQDWLAQIKFQQTYTSGWSGALKLPIGLEGGISGAQTLAENQLSLPEIVDAFTNFVTRASEQCQLIIGIDEMDKLESDEKAQRFLNDIKSVFGLDRCFYLISVSENAMSSFERRGLPFRDVFDSSFDAIIYVDYLDFAGAQHLIEKRIVGKPIPFLALSYCLSGGLARDMIRVFRNLVELLQAHPERDDLETLCHALIKSDLKAKLRAGAITAKKINLEAEVDEFLQKLYEFESVPLSEELLFKAAQELFAFADAKPPNSVTKNKEKEILLEYEKLSSLHEELATYTYYVLTILQFFKNTLTKSALMREDEGATLDYLAKARQMFAVSPLITRAMLNKFRDIHSLQGTFPLAAKQSESSPIALKERLGALLSILESGQS